MRKFLEGLALSVGTLVVCALLAEGALRFLPVSTGLEIQETTAEDPIARAAPARAFVYSKEADFYLANEGRTNAQGFVNAVDYDAAADGPLLALIGDSFVEAAMVPFEQSIAGRLAAAAAPTGRVYSFALSGAPLSQYLVWARHAHDLYAPGAMAFLIINNDFDESLRRYKSAPPFHYFEQAEDGYELVLSPYQPSIVRRLASESALMRYLFLNLELLHAPAKIRAALARWSEEPEAGSGATPTTEDDAAAGPETQRDQDMRLAVDLFLDRVVEISGLPPGRLLFILDADRAAIYRGDAARQGRGASSAYRYMAAEARAGGFRVIDLSEAFQQDYARDGERFEFARDGHWNAYGHGRAAAAVVDHPLFQELFNDRASDAPQ